jgi:PEP-CTERM motif
MQGSRIYARKKLASGSNPRRMLLALAALCAGAAPAGAQTYVGNDFSPGSSLLSSLETEGYKDLAAPLVILQEYNPSGPATTGAIFGSAGTVNDVSFYGGFSGGGEYHFTVYALALDSINTAANELTLTVVGDETFSGSVSFQGVHKLSANFSVGAGDYLAFAGIGPFYPQVPNDAVGSDATYESSPNTYTATPPTAGQTFTVGANGGSATYNYISDVHDNQGRSYGIGVDYVQTSRIPEPSTWAMLIIGFAGLGYLGWRRGRGRAAAA